MYQGARRSGKVLSVNDKRGIFKMRFDDFPTAEFDYSFSYKSPAWSYITPPTVPAAAAETTNKNDEPLLTISRKFKALIKVNLHVIGLISIHSLSSLVYVTTRLGIDT